MSIRIVTHAYAKTLPQYAVFLRAQLTSLVRYAPAVMVSKVSVCCTGTDERVLRVVQDFAPLLRSRLHVITMSEGSLFRRSIGRNIVALSSTEDVVWFSDVDHVFGPGCLVSVRDQVRAIGSPALMWPKSLWIHADHSLGDDFVRDNIDAQGMVDLDELGIADFVNQKPSPAFEPKTYHSAIGGVQIVSGDFVRRHGYLQDQPKWRQPRTDGKPFGDFRDDVKFRRFCLSKIPGVPIEIPQLYRLRHTAVTYKG